MRSAGHSWRRGRGVPRRHQAPARADDKPVKKVHWKDGKRPDKTPLFSGVTSYGGLVFVAGMGAHFEGDIKAHTKHVLDELQSSSSRSAPRWRRSSR